VQGPVIKWCEMYPGSYRCLVQDEYETIYGFKTFDVLPDAEGNRTVSEGQIVEFEEGEGRLDKQGKAVRTAVNISTILTPKENVSLHGPERGVVYTYEDFHGHGFISKDVYSNRGIFVHARDIMHPFKGPLCIDDEVSFAIVPSRKKKGDTMAVNVRVLRRYSKDFPQ
jgi:cold shock CspA family protein